MSDQVDVKGSRGHNVFNGRCAKSLSKIEESFQRKGDDRMSVNPLVELTMSGQSIWYDGIQQGLITSGGTPTARAEEMMATGAACELGRHCESRN